MITTIIHHIHRLARLDHDMTEVVSMATVAFVLKGLGAGLAFGFNLLLARRLGAKDAGVYYLALTVTTFGTIVGRMGLDSALLRFTAANVAFSDWVKVAGVCRRGTRLAIGVSAVATIVVMIGAPWIARLVFSEPTLTAPLRLMSLAILPMSLLVLYAELLKGRKKISQAMLVNGMGVPLVSLLLLAILGSLFGVIGAVMSYVASTILVLSLGIVLWWQATPELRGVTGHFDTHLLITTSIPLFWIAIINFLMNAADTLLLGIWVDSKSVGIYGVAIRIAILIQFILLAVNTIAAPKFAALYVQEKRKALRDLARNTAGLMALVAALVVLPLMIAPTWVLGLFGPDFTAGAPALRVLAVGQFVNVAVGSVGPLLIMSGYEKVLQRQVMYSAVVGVVLNVLLIPNYGILGAAMARSFSLMMLNLLSLWAVRKYLGIWYFG